MAMPSSADIRGEIAEVTASTNALLAVAEEQSRDFDPDEEKAFNENADKLKELNLKLERAEDREAKARMFAEATAVASQPVQMIPGVRGPAKAFAAPARVGRLNAFANTREGHQNAHDCGMWLRAVIARGNRQHDQAAEERIASRGWGHIQNVATEGSPTGGGYLVPTPLSEAIIDVRALAGVSRQLSRVVVMTSETQDIPKKTGGTTVYYPGEAAAPTSSDQTWGQVHLTAKRRAILSKISQELRDDALINVVDDLASQMGTDFAVKEDAEFFKGDGTSTYGGVTGILTALGAGGIYTPANSAGLSVWSGLTNTEVANAMALLPDKYWQYGPSWVCSSVFYFSVLVRLQAAAGGNTFTTLENGASRPMYLGFPVYFTNQMPTATATSTVSLLFGAFNQAAIIGDRGGVIIKQSEHLNFDQDVLAVLGTTRYDINCHDCGTASAAGAVVALKTAAS